MGLKTEPILWNMEEDPMCKICTDNMGPDDDG